MTPFLWLLGLQVVGLVFILSCPTRIVDRVSSFVVGVLMLVLLYGFLSTLG